MEWQPIETAPKTGDYILVGRLQRNGAFAYVCDAFWGTYDYGHIQRASQSGWNVQPPLADAYPMRGSRRYPGFISEDDAPTHWMPLPEPPK